MSEIEILEKCFIETNKLIWSEFETIGVKWNHPKHDIEPYMKVESVEKLDKLEAINKGIEEIKQHLEKIKNDHKNHEKYAEYFHKMHQSYVKATQKLEYANELKARSLNKTNSLEVALAYLAPFLGYINELSESTVIKKEKSSLLAKIGWYYHRKALNLGARLAFKAMPNLIYAKKLYYQAWELDHKNLDAAHGLAKCMYKLSKHKNCIQFLSEEFKHEEEKKSIRDYYRILAICYRKTGDYNNANKMIELGLINTPNDDKVKKEKGLIDKLVEKKKSEPFNSTLFKNATKTKHVEQDYVYRHTESEEFRILSIDGGGIRGIIPAYWACEIEKRAHKPIAHLFNLLSGTSTGGIVAAGLSFPNPDGKTPKFAAYELLDVYRHRGNEIFPPTSWLKEKMDIVKSLFGSRYQDTGRKKLFEELVGKDAAGNIAKISSSLTELVITSANEDCIITSHLFNRFDARYDEYFNDTFVDTLMCTSAAPYYFPSYEIKNKGFFVDGGVHVNNPADVAYAEARRYGFSSDRISVVSMGTGAYVPGLLDETSWRSKLFNNQSNLKARGALYWAAHLKDVALEGQCGNTDISLGSIFKSKYHRMQVWFESAITLDQVDEPNITLLTDIASQYVEEEDSSNENSINKLVESLVKDF
jgi:uncharacterized protein